MKPMYQFISQGVILLIDLMVFLISKSYDHITTATWYYTLMPLSILGFLLQLRLKIHITPLFVLILLWTLVMIINWPEAPRNHSGTINWQPFLTALLFSAQAWWMYTFNKSRW